MDLKQLKYFLTVVDERQITAAARKLHMAQPPLSQQMKLLESELGTELFKRGPHHIELTDAGRLLTRRAQQLLALADSTSREIADLCQGLRGTLAIGTISSSGSILWHPGLQRVRALAGRDDLSRVILHDGSSVHACFQRPDRRPGKYTHKQSDDRRQNDPHAGARDAKIARQILR